MAISYGASAIGLVSEMPSGPGPIPETLIREISSTIPPGVSTFLLTSLTNSKDIIEQQRRCGTNTLQLTDTLENGSYGDLIVALPGISIVQVIHVIDDNSIEEAQEIAPYVHAVLLDSGNPKADTKELGGTGRTHNWSISRKIVENTNIPIILAGGLIENNVADAILTVRPYGVDVCSGVRAEDNLDENKLRGFFSQVSSMNEMKQI